MRYPVKSVQVARGTGARTRSRMVSEALPTMWHDEALPSTVLLARVMPWLHKKLLIDAPKVGTPSCRELGVVIGFLPRMDRIFSLGTGKRHSGYNPQAPITSKATSRARRTGRTYRIMQTLLMSTWEPCTALLNGVGQLAANAVQGAEPS